MRLFSYCVQNKNLPALKLQGKAGFFMRCYLATATVVAAAAAVVVTAAVVAAAAENKKNQNDAAAAAVITKEIHKFPSFRLHYILLRKQKSVT